MTGCCVKKNHIIIIVAAMMFLLLFNMSASAAEKPVKRKKPVNYNDPSLPKEVNKLRKFRDMYLKKFALGREFVDYYYKYGPTAADAISSRDRLRSLVRICLLPLMYAGKNFDIVLILLKLFGMFIVGTLLSCGAKAIKGNAKKYKRINYIK